MQSGKGGFPAASKCLRDASVTLNGNRALPQGPEEGGVPGLMDGFLYGVPFTTNTWYMYYDKRVFSEEDAGSLDAMLEKGAVSFPFTSSWYLPAFCFGNGCTLFDGGSVLGVA